MKSYGLTPDHRAAVDATLEQHAEYYAALAAEIRNAAPLTDRNPLAAMAAERIVAEIATMRRELARQGR